jgi:hypothetical protein
VRLGGPQSQSGHSGREMTNPVPARNRNEAAQQMASHYSKPFRFIDHDISAHKVTGDGLPIHDSIPGRGRDFFPLQRLDRLRDFPSLQSNALVGLFPLE